MKKTKHFYHGCPWANGSPQQADTIQVFYWKEVTCGHCLNNRNSNGTSRFWTNNDQQKFYILKEYEATD